jgi:Ca2+-binding EF-hand superfamily protein
MKLPHVTVVLAGIALLGPLQWADAQNRSGARSAQYRFAGLDRNGDGVITRDEWRGNDRSFRSHDWDGDGVLSGDEIRAAERRMSPDDGTDDRRLDENDWTSRRFTELDQNADGRISWSEWVGSDDVFRRVDRNDDGFLSRVEFKGDTDSDSTDRFDLLDSDHDGWVQRDEWHGDPAVFRRMDRNRDDVLSRAELEADRTQTGDVVASATFKAGYARGFQEGVAAGREDFERNQGWDLEGQRELERADSGYSANMGPRGDYQSGYRQGFRTGYREGWDRARR